MSYTTQQLSAAISARNAEAKKAQEALNTPMPSHLSAIINKRATAPSDTSVQPIRQAFLGKNALTSNPERSLVSASWDANARLQLQFDDGQKITTEPVPISEYIEQHIAVVTNPVVPYIQFETELPDPPYNEGMIFYDAYDHCLAYYNDDSHVKVSLSREQMVRVYNDTAFAIPDGKACYINGALGGWPTVGLTSSTSKIQAESTIGLCTGRIEAHDYGYICVSGNVNGIDTSAYPAGTVLYVDSVAGNLTNIPALQPNYNIEIATVLTQSATTGSLLVRVSKKNWFPSLKLIHTTSSILPTTPVVFKPNTVQYNDGFTYSSATGEITFLQSASYSVSMQVNTLPSASNKHIYFYFEKNEGSGWVIDRYSARLNELINNYESQIVFTDSEYFSIGTKIRLVLWGESTVTLVSTDIPGTIPNTVTLPAFRLNIA